MVIGEGESEYAHDTWVEHRAALLRRSRAGLVVTEWSLYGRPVGGFLGSVDENDGCGAPPTRRRRSRDDGPSDQELLRAHVAGDPQAFGEIVRRHRDRLWRVALRITHDSNDAEDALHDGLIRAFRNAGTFRGDAAVGSWLYRVITNAALDHVTKAPPIADEIDLDDPEIDRPAPDAGSDLRLALHEGLLSLDPNQRAAFFLVAIRNFTHSEAAELLDVPVGTAKVWVWRARGRLIEFLDGAR